MFDIKVIPNLQSLIVQLIASGILFYVISTLVFKPVKEILTKRQVYIEKSIKEADDSKEEANKLKAEYEAKILSAKQESSDIISKARAYGEDIKTKAVNESKELAKLELEKGKRSLENERSKAMKSMSNEITEMAILAAGKVLREKIDSKKDKKLVKLLIEDMEKSYE